MSTTRWEKERSAWLKARAGHRLGVRRRAEQLAAAARRRDRFDSGIGDSAFGEVTTRNVFYRSVHREEGAANTMGWLTWTLIWMLCTYLLVGPAMLIGMTAYGIWWQRIPQWGRMRSAPYYKAAAGLAVIGVALLATHSLLVSQGAPRMFVGSWQVWPLDGGVAFLSTYCWMQLVLGLARAGWRVRAWGWPAIARAGQTATSAVQTIELETLDPGKPSAALEAPSSAIAPIEISVDNDGIEDWMVDEENEPG